MKHIENSKNQSQEPIDLSKVSAAFQDYIKARNELFTKYGKAIPELHQAA